MDLSISRVGSFRLRWGESLVWDEMRDRLYFVDCLANTLHWLDGTSTEPAGFELPSMPTGVVPTDAGVLVVVLEDGLYVCDPDDRRVEMLSPIPDAIGGRCNDACADLDGNIITGKLNFGPGEGSTWQFSPDRGWSLLDPAISNTNGPAALDVDGRPLLIVGDTSADYFAYEYDAPQGTVGQRWVFGDASELEGGPDGTTVDSDGGLWCALVGGSQLVRFTADGLDETIPVPVRHPTDVAFGGADLDRLYVTTTDRVGDVDGELDGALLVVDGLGQTGRPEPRARLEASSE